MARKTVTSTEVKRRWNEANYKKYQLYLRIDDDRDLIDYIESQKELIGTTELFRQGIEKLKEGAVMPRRLEK